MENDRSGTGLRYGYGSEVDLVTLTIGSGFPANGVRVGLFTDNIGNKTDADDMVYYRIRQTTGGGATPPEIQEPTTDKDNGNDFYFFDIKDAVDGDVFVISGKCTDDYGPYLGGVTFDTLTGGGLATLVLAVETSGSNLLFTWDSQSGKLYDLLSSTGLTTPPNTPWAAHDDGSTVTTDLEADPSGTNSLTVPRPTGDATRFFAVVEKDAPPLLDENFDGVTAPALPAGWVAGGTSGTPATVWQLGGPGGVDTGPTAAFSGANCVGTNLTAEYGPDAAVTLTSPAMLIPAGGATLTLQQWIDTEGSASPDFGTITVLDADSADAFLATVNAANIEGIDTMWAEAAFPLPAAALGKNVKLQFLFTSNATEEWAGWYIDDVKVTAD